MACKFNKKHKDCLYWIYPLVILSLIIFTAVRDERKKELDARSGADQSVNLTTAITSNIRISDSLMTDKPGDSIIVFYATK